MKISKVRHTKAAVGVMGNETGGFLYVDPSRGGALDLDNRFRELNRTALRLYSVIVPLKPDEEKDRNKNKIYREFQKLNREYQLDNYSVDSLRAGRIIFTDDDQIQGDPVEFIKTKIKKSLRNIDYSDDWDALLRYVFGIDQKLNIEADELKKFSEFLCDDYQRTKTGTQIKKAIKNQNMPVQTGRKGICLPDKKDLSKSGAGERQALNEFLLSYANLDKNVRDDYLRKLRRLVQVYFYGPDQVRAGEFNVWEDHEAHREDQNLFLTDFETEHADKDGTVFFSSGATDYDKLQILVEQEKELIHKNNEKKQQIEELRKKRDEIRKVTDRIAVEIREQNIYCYRRAVMFTREDPDKLFFSNDTWNLCFIHLMENEVEHIFKNFHSKDSFKLAIGYLGEKTWKYLINYLSVKYISIGKAVYHYACNDLDKEGDQVFGKADVSAISSFDYEMIKASEELQRNTAVYIAFAVQNFAQSAIRDDYRQKKDENKEDVLLYTAKDITEGRKPTALREVLQFWGGQSKWYENLPEDTDEFLLAIKERLYLLRNKTFHFKSASKGITQSQSEYDYILKMMKQDLVEVSEVRRKTYYSNNTWMFYKQPDIRRMMDEIYKRNAERGAQVPSFKNILGRKALHQFLENIGAALDTNDVEVEAKWQSSLYFVLKEIYYQKFLMNPALTDNFVDKVEEKYKTLQRISDEHMWGIRNKKEETELMAIKDFRETLCQISQNKDFSQVCQFFMTEYNAQNQGNRKVKTTRMKKDHPEIFRHYKMILYNGIKELFADYMRVHFKFLQHPVYSEENLAVEDFLAGWSADTYKNLLKETEKDPELQCWYICAHFLPPRQVNQLGGTFKHYLQYSEDVKRRAEENHQKLSISSDLSADECRKLICMMDFVGKLSGVVSAKFEDYFDIEDGETFAEKYVNYINYIGDYADIKKMHERAVKEHEQKERNGKKGKEERKRREKAKNSRHVVGLKSLKFLDIRGGNASGHVSAGESGQITATLDDPASLYFDETNPILNRNVILAKLYAPDKVLRNAVAKIKYEEYKEYSELKDEYPKNLCEGGSTRLSEQKLVNQFRDSKHRVELLNLYEYAELISELQGQLVNWSYLRERDMMYFQLGFHYLCLRNDSQKPAGYTRIQNINGKTIDGAILYQLLAVFIYGYPVYRFMKETGEWDKKKIKSNLMIGAKIRKFADVYSADIFDAGKELFQVMAEERNVNDLRDYIDHFKYYVRPDRSMLDIYSEVFDRFFTYDQKYRKNVPNVLGNILERHFVMMGGLRFEETTKRVGKDGSKPMALMQLKNLKSDSFTYKLIDDEKVTNEYSEEKPITIQLPAKGKKFLQDVKNILEYHEG